MRIDITNFNKLRSKEVYFHDQIFLECNYNPICKEIIILTEDIMARVQHRIVFHNVESFEMIGGESWGGDSMFSHIIDWSCVSKEDETLLSKVKNRIALYYEEGKKEYNTFFQTRFLLANGNLLDILCEFVDIDPVEDIFMKNKIVYDNFREGERREIIKDSKIRNDGLKDLISDIKVVFIDEDLPQFFTQNGISMYSDFISNWTRKVNISCKVKIHSSEVDAILQPWFWFLVKAGYVINTVSIECNDITVNLNRREAERIAMDLSQR